MELNQTTLRGILAQILSVDQKYIVPKQGNWWNPQEANANVANWCAYQIRRNQPRTVPFYDEGLDGSTAVNAAATERIATIDLQFVGPDSETLANSVALWPLRGDVAEQFAQAHGALMNRDMSADSSFFYQDGENTVMAWNVTISVLYYQIMETGQGPFPTITLNGNVNN